jgi:tetratricopeptide (TPR) repeat protein
MKNKFLVLLVFIFSCFYMVAEENISDKLRKDLVTFGVKQNSINTYFEATEKTGKEDYLATLETAVKQDSKNFLALDDIGAFYSNAYEYDKAEGYYKKSIAVNKNNPFPYIRLYENYKEDENFDDAAKIVKSLITNIPEHPEGYYSLANLYYMAKEYKNSITNAEIAIEKYKNLDEKRFYEEALTKESYIVDAYYMIANNYYLLYEDQKVVDIYLSQVDKMNELNHPFKEEFKKIAETSNNAIKETNKAEYEKNRKLLENK